MRKRLQVIVMKERTGSEEYGAWYTHAGDERGTHTGNVETVHGSSLGMCKLVMQKCALVIRRELACTGNVIIKLNSGNVEGIHTCKTIRLHKY